MHKLNIEKINSRTDLAIEKYKEDVIKEKVDNTFVTRINKDSINYTTIEFDDPLDFDSGKKIEKVLINELKRVLKQKEIKENDSAFIVGLGNKKSTPDSLGPNVIDNIIVTRYLFDNNIEVEKGFRKVSSFSPGVTGITGIETYDIISSIINKTKPNFLIVIDSLKSSSVDRLNKTIQISTFGINPGSGIGNKRKEISEKTVGIPVISIGVPTVVDTSTILEEYINKKIELKDNFIVTPVEIDLFIDKLSKIISVAINNVLHKNVTHL